MKRWKKAGLLTLLMGGCFAAGAAASNGIEKVEAFLRPDFKVVVNGVVAQLENPVLIYKDTSYLPVKTVGTLIGAKVFWDSQTNSIYVDPRVYGQPVTTDTSQYRTIKMQQPYGNKVKFRGREYGLLSLMADNDIYYREADLTRMGIDTRGVPKVKEEYTGFLFIKQDEAYKLWENIPEMYASYEPVISGVYNEEVKEKLLALANSFPTLGQENPDSYPYFPYIFYIDAVENNPNQYYMLGQNSNGDLLAYVTEYAQDRQGNWYRTFFQSKNIQKLHEFFSSKK